MTFEQALAIARRIGAASPSFGPDAPAAQCWIDRIAWANEVAQRPGAIAASLARAIAEANRYAGRQGATHTKEPPCPNECE